MSIKDKIDLCAQSYKLYFFKEGMFYRVYNQNAMWFQKNVNAYKISVKFVKIVNQKIYSLGFPQNVLHSNSFNFNLKKIKETPNYVCYQNNNIVTAQDYNSWCAVQGVQLQKEESSQGIIKELQYFDLVNKMLLQTLKIARSVMKKIRSLLNSYLGTLSHANTYSLVEKAVNKLNSKFYYFFGFTKNYSKIYIKTEYWQWHYTFNFPCTNQGMIC